MTERGFYLDSLVRRAHEAVGGSGFISELDLERLSYLVRWAAGREALMRIIGLRMNGLRDITNLLELHRCGVIDLHAILELEELEKYTRCDSVMKRIETGDFGYLSTLELIRFDGDPRIGVFTKFRNGKNGVSSQLVNRYEALARGDIESFLSGEVEYEVARYELEVYYETRNYCDIPPELREMALNQMLALGDMQNVIERKVSASQSRVLSRERQEKI